MMYFLIEDRHLGGTAGSANRGTPALCNLSAFLI